MDVTVPFAIVLADSPRARAYLQSLCVADLFPYEILLMPARWTCGRPASTEERQQIGFDPDESVHQTIARHGLSYVECPTADINAPSTVDAVRRLVVNVVVFAGPSGQILKRSVLSQGKLFLHAHPGRLPHFRGSTTVYYSILEEGSCGVSVIVFDERIDTGDVLLRRQFERPSAIAVDTLYDPDIRARTMVAAIRKLQQDGGVFAEPQQSERLPYYVVHPVLKHLALLSSGAWV